MKRLVYLTMAIAMLLALFPAAVVAQEAPPYSLSWTPATPNEGGSADFTLTYTGDLSMFSWMMLTASATPGGTCSQVIGQQFSTVPTVTGSQTFNQPGVYNLCVDLWVNGTEILGSATITVLNAPPFSTGAVYVQPEPSTAGEPIYAPEAYFNDYDPQSTWGDWTCRVNYGDGSGWQDAIWEFPINQYNACKGPDHIYATAGTYTVQFEVTETNVGSTIATVTHVVEPAGPSGPGVYDISVTSKSGRRNYTYTGLVTIAADQGPLSKAAVTAEWWQLLDGTRTKLLATQTASTSKSGVAKFTLSASNGTYDLCVTQLVKTGYEFPPDVVCYTDIHPQ